MSSSFLHTCTPELQGTRWVCWCINERNIWVGLSEKNVFLTLYRRIFPVVAGPSGRDNRICGTYYLGVPTATAGNKLFNCFS